MSSENSRLIQLKYNVYVGANDPTLTLDTTGIDKSELKSTLKKEIGDYISQKIGSIGNLHLPKQQTGRKRTNKGILLGKRGGRICRTHGEYLFVYDLFLVTVIDGGVNKSLDAIHEEVRKSIDGFNFECNLAHVFGTLAEETSKTFYVDVTEPKGTYKEPKFERISAQNLTSTVPEEIYQEMDLVEELTKYGSVADPVEATDGENADDILSSYDLESQVESYKEDYKENGVEVRKPTEQETERIVDAVLNRLERMSTGEDYVYIEEHPDFWEKVDCSNPSCQQDHSDVYHFNRSKMRQILLKQMKEGFGITKDRESRREMSSPELSNFYIDHSGQVYFRPEELISWIIDLIHYVEPLCDECHSQVGGNSQHTEVSNNSTTKSISIGSYEEYVSDGRDSDDEEVAKLEEKDNTPSIATDTEKVAIDTDNVESANWELYRTPKPSECGEITKRIIKHLYELGTRYPTNHKSQIDNIYRVVLKRGEPEGPDAPDIFSCKHCNCEIDVSEVERHHTTPLSLREAHMDVINTVDLPPQESPIIVSDSRNEFILTDKFLWRLESHIRNLDISALTCSECISKENSNQDARDNLVQSTLEKSVDEKAMDREEIIDAVFSHIKDAEQERKVTIECVFCDVGRGGDDTTTAWNEGGRYETRRGHFTPVSSVQRLGIDPNKSKTPLVGACAEHEENLIDSIVNREPSDNSEVHEHVRTVLRENFYK